MGMAVKPLVVGIPAHWGTVMPPLQHSAYGAAVLENQFESLVRQGKNGLIEPCLASSWEISPDRRIVRFKIDTKRHFSDGSPLRAIDFKRSWEEGLRLVPKSNNSSIADALDRLKGFAGLAKTGAIEGVRVVGDDTLELEYDRPLRPTIEYLADGRYAAYKLVDGLPIGTGPYVMKEEGQALLLTPNEHYRGSEPRFPEARIVVAAPETAEAKLRSGELDALIFAERFNLPGCAGTSGDVRCVFGQESSHLVINVNGLAGRFFQDHKHRLALQALIQQKLEESGLPERLKADHLSRDPQTFLPFQAGRLSEPEATRLVQEGQRHIPELIKASKRHPIYLVSGRELAWLIALLQDAGVTVAAKSGTIEFSQVLEMIYKTHEPDLIYGSFSVNNSDPDGLYHNLGRQGAIYSPMAERASVQDLFEAGRAIMSQELLAPHYEKTARAILAEVPNVHLGFTPCGVAYSPNRVTVSDNFVNRNTNQITIFEPR
jgi:ABC-type transport system substrate-binding protein